MTASREDHSATEAARDYRPPVVEPPINWTCSIGEAHRLTLPPGSDEPMRQGLAEVYRRVTGVDPDYIFSGWGDPLPESYRAVVEDREPNHAALIDELARNWWAQDADVLHELLARLEVGSDG